MLLVAVDLATWSGYAFERSRRFFTTAARYCGVLPSSRPLQLGPFEMRVPNDWGNIEVDHQGNYSVHNRPDWARVDGDAVWYGTAIEIRFEPAGNLRRPSNEPVSELRKEFTVNSRKIVATLRIANGVGSVQRRVALKAFKSIRIPEDRKHENLHFKKRMTTDRSVRYQKPSDTERVATDFVKVFSNRDGNQEE